MLQHDTLQKLVQLMHGKSGWHVTFTLQSVFDYAIYVHSIDPAGCFDMAKFVSLIQTSIYVIGDGQDNVEYSTEHIYSKHTRFRLVEDAYVLYRQQLYVLDTNVVLNIRETVFDCIRPLLGRLVTERMKRLFLEIPDDCKPPSAPLDLKTNTKLHTQNHTSM